MLELLELDIGGIKFKDSAEFAVGLGCLQNLKILRFSCRQCNVLSNAEKF
jgi:hypothetical protein